MVDLSKARQAKVDDDALMARRERDKEWAATDIGKLFYAYERAHAGAWIADTELGFRDDLSINKRVKTAWATEQKARAAFLLALRGFE